MEVSRWSSKSLEQLIDELREASVYTVEAESKLYHIEVQLLENTGAYVHVAVSVDDGSLPGSVMPVTEGFIVQKS